MPEAPRDRILAAAHDLFYRDGIRATGIDAIIPAAEVTKTTFYRQFPSKAALVQAYLVYRHELWMTWFTRALAMRHSAQMESARAQQPYAPLLEALGEWFAQPGYRGCAFINALAELGEEAAAITRRHKQDMSAALTPLYPGRPSELLDAIAVAVDGAILRAQSGQRDEALAGLRLLLVALK
jgi:AcrR family transcriptional regulator